MSFNKEALLASLIAAGHSQAQDYAFSLVTGDVDITTSVEVGDVVTPGADIGVETDATTLDVNGMPWDSRIHAKTKTRNKDDSWKYAVGIDREVLVPQVEAELRAAGYGKKDEVANPPVAATVTPPPVQAPTPGAGLPPVAPGLPPITPPPATPVKVDFPTVSSEDDMDDNALTQTAVALVSKHGEQSLINLLTLFKLPAGATVKDIPAGWKYAFFQYASSDENLRAQSVI